MNEEWIIAMISYEKKEEFKITIDMNSNNTCFWYVLVHNLSVHLIILQLQSRILKEQLNSRVYLLYWTENSDGSIIFSLFY